MVFSFHLLQDDYGDERETNLAAVIAAAAQWGGIRMVNCILTPPQLLWSILLQLTPINLNLQRFKLLWVRVMEGKM